VQFVHAIINALILSDIFGSLYKYQTKCFAYHAIIVKHVTHKLSWSVKHTIKKLTFVT